MNQSTTFEGAADRLRTACRESHSLGFDDGYQLGYVQGARAGRLAGFCWGLLLTAGSLGLGLTYLVRQ